MAVLGIIFIYVYACCPICFGAHACVGLFCFYMYIPVCVCISYMKSIYNSVYVNVLAAVCICVYAWPCVCVCVCACKFIYVALMHYVRISVVFMCERVCIVMWGLTTLHLIRWDISDYLLQRKSLKIKKKKREILTG